MANSTMKTILNLAFVLLNLLVLPVNSSDRLPALGASQTETSVSGLSSGAYMAVQYLVAHSSSVIGAGVVAGGPYYCSAGQRVFIAICMGKLSPDEPEPLFLANAVLGFSLLQKIDPLYHLKNARIYAFSGTEDRTVIPPLVETTVRFFKHVGVPETNIIYVNHMRAGHALITPSYGNACETSTKYFINQCQEKELAYDQPGEILKHIYGTLNPPTVNHTGKIYKFDQREFPYSFGWLRRWDSMDRDAYIYIPTICLHEQGCRIHVAFHGCQQSYKIAGNVFNEKTSYNDWADSNRIIVLYPQIETVPFLNPDGCWDWYAYTGLDFAWQSGAQIFAVRAMVERLMSVPE